MQIQKTTTMTLRDTDYEIIHLSLCKLTHAIADAINEDGAIDIVDVKQAVIDYLERNTGIQELPGFMLYESLDEIWRELNRGESVIDQIKEFIIY